MKNNRNILYLGDSIIVLLMIAFCIAFAVWSRISSPLSAESVQVTLNGKSYAVYPLHTDLDTRIGQTGVQLVISDGKARIADSDCKDKSCVHSGAIGAGESGTSLVCLPNRVAVTLHTHAQSRSEREVDGIVG